MRDDSFGLWWHDVPKPKGKGSRGQRQRGPMPPIPETGWLPPTEFPNLSAAKVIGFDVETKDLEMRQAGPGWGRGKSNLIGVSIAVEDGSSWYFPFAHESQPELNMDRDQVLAYCAHVLGMPVPKVGANLIYDVGSLLAEGVAVKGPLYDVQFAEALLDSETPRVDLDSLAERYLGANKVTSILYDWLASWLGGAANERQRQHLYLSPPSLAGPYAEADASLPIRVLEKQWPAMVKRGVLDVFDMECRLIPLLVDMRMKGAPIDLERAHTEHDNLTADLKEITKRMTHVAGREVNPNSRDSLSAAFKSVGLPEPKTINNQTKEEKISYSAPLLEKIDHDLPRLILEHRRTTKVRDTFIQSYIIDKNVNGRIHCSFHPLRNDEGGARSGRFSSSDPNLQNIPVRTLIGKRVRECFVAQGTWVKGDYSQVEYRMLAHHAVGDGATELRKVYNEDPTTDYHELTAIMVERMTGQALDRRNIKNINFGLIYGMGEPKLAAGLGLTKSEGHELFGHYHAAAPFARATMEAAANEVHRMGYVETISGRKSDFSRWGPTWYAPGQADMDYAGAAATWGAYNIERSRTHKALNRKLQGGAADLMKKAMVEAYEGGLFAEEACGIPLLTVHDELDFDDLGDPSAPCWAELKHVMETATEGLRVPIVMDLDRGPTWGSID